jgi:hypothetical protein
MKYKYVSKTCVFAEHGDVFEKSKNGYVHNITDDNWVGVPKWMVEDTNAFEPVNEELEDFRNNLITWLEDVIEFDEKSAAGKKALRPVLRYIKEYSSELPEEE